MDTSPEVQKNPLLKFSIQQESKALKYILSAIVL
jgi:hypothetical protein